MAGGRLINDVEDRFRARAGSRDKHFLFLPCLSYKKVMASEAAKIIGQRAKDARAKAGYSLRGFSQIAGFNPNVLSRIERGSHNMTLSTLLRLSHFLDLPASTLLEGIEEIPADADDKG